MLWNWSYTKTLDSLTTCIKWCCYLEMCYELFLVCGGWSGGLGGCKDKCCSTNCHIFMSFIAAILFFCSYPSPAVACHISEDRVASVCRLSYVNRGCSVGLDRSHPYKRTQEYYVAEVVRFQATVIYKYKHLFAVFIIMSSVFRWKCLKRPLERWKGL